MAAEPLKSRRRALRARYIVRRRLVSRFLGRVFGQFSVHPMSAVHAPDRALPNPNALIWPK